MQDYIGRIHGREADISHDARPARARQWLASWVRHYRRNRAPKRHGLPDPAHGSLASFPAAQTASPSKSPSSSQIARYANAWAISRYSCTRTFLNPAHPRSRSARSGASSPAFSSTVKLSRFASGVGRPPPRSSGWQDRGTLRPRGADSVQPGRAALPRERTRPQPLHESFAALPKNRATPRAFSRRSPDPRSAVPAFNRWIRREVNQSRRNWPS